MPTRYQVVLLVGFVLAIVVSILAWDAWREQQMKRLDMEQQIALNPYVGAMLRAANEQGLGEGEVQDVGQGDPVKGIVLGEADVVELLSQVDESVRYVGPESARLERTLRRGTWILSPPDESGLIGLWIPPADTKYNAVEVPANGLPRARR